MCTSFPGSDSFVLNVQNFYLVEFAAVNGNSCCDQTGMKMKIFHSDCSISDEFVEDERVLFADLVRIAESFEEFVPVWGQKPLTSDLSADSFIHASHSLARRRFM